MSQVQNILLLVQLQMSSKLAVGVTEGNFVKQYL